MNRIVSIVILVLLAFSCLASDEGMPQTAEQTDIPANAWRPEKKPKETPTSPVSSTNLLQMDGPSSGEIYVNPVASLAEQGLDLSTRWPSGAEMQAMVEDFMTSVFVNNKSRIGFGDLAYTDVFLDFSINELGRVDQLDGVISGMYESYSFGIPVVRRGVDAISGSRQVNWEDVIVSIDESRWLVQPVVLRGVPSFEIKIDSSIELVQGDTLVRLVKKDSVFTCSEYTLRPDGKEELRITWKISQYERGPVHDIQSFAEPDTLVPVVMAWEPGFITGYLVSLPEGRAEFIQKIQLVPSGNIETDRYNFLVLLTQQRGAILGIPDSIGAVDPVWLALLLYDYVVIP